MRKLTLTPASLLVAVNLVAKGINKETCNKQLVTGEIKTWGEVIEAGIAKVVFSNPKHESTKQYLEGLF